MSSADARAQRKTSIHSNGNLNISVTTTSNSVANTRIPENLIKQHTSNTSRSSSENACKSTKGNTVISPTKAGANSNTKSFNSKLRDKLNLQIGTPHNSSRRSTSSTTEYQSKSAPTLLHNNVPNKNISDLVSKVDLLKRNNDTNSAKDNQRKSTHSSDSHLVRNQSTLIPQSHHSNIIHPHPPPLTPAPPFANPAILNLLLRPPGALHAPPPPPPSLAQPPRMHIVPSQIGTTNPNQNGKTIIPAPTTILQLPYFIPIPVPIPIPIPIPMPQYSPARASASKDNGSDEKDLTSLNKNSESRRESSSRNGDLVIKTEKEPENTSKQLTTIQSSRNRFVNHKIEFYKSILSIL